MGVAFGHTHRVPKVATMDEQDAAGGRYGPLLVALGLLVFIGMMTVTSLGFRPQARQIPLVVGLPVSFVLFVQTIREVVALRTGRTAAEPPSRARPEPVTAASRPATGEVPEEQRPDPTDDLPWVPDATEPAASVPAIYGWILVLVLAFYLFGMQVGVPIFIAAFARIYGRERWRTIAIMIAITFVVIQVFFVQILQIQLHDGVLLEALR